MREAKIYMWIGVWLFVLPFLGIPGSWKNALLILTAISIFLHSLVRYHFAQKPRAEETSVDATHVPSSPEEIATH